MDERLRLTSAAWQQYQRDIHHETAAKGQVLEALS